MRVNIYAEEFLNEIQVVTKEKRNRQGHILTWKGVRMYLYSSHRLNEQENADDRSAVTLWLPRSTTRRIELANTLRKMGDLIENEIEDDEY